jgi:hypothetical protein
MSIAFRTRGIKSEYFLRTLTALPVWVRLLTVMTASLLRLALSLYR